MKSKRKLVVCGNGHRFLVTAKDDLYKKADRRKQKKGSPERRLLAAIFGRASADLSNADCPKCAKEREARYKKRREDLQSRS